MILRNSSIISIVQWFAMYRFSSIIFLGAFLFLGGSASNAMDNEDVAFVELGGDQCYMFARLVPEQVEGNHTIELPLEIVIDNEHDYRKLFDHKLVRQSCDGVDLAKLIINVDFSKNTVLGLWSSGSCADTGFERKLLRNDATKTVTYFVTTVSGPKPSCMGPGPDSLNLIAAPKIPAGYTLKFKTTP